MPRAIILPSAEADLRGIWEHISRDSPQNADCFVDGIYQTCNDTLAYNPRIGRRRDELSPGLRGFPYGEYVIFYIFHGRRDIEALFEQ